MIEPSDAEIAWWLRRTHIRDETDPRDTTEWGAFWRSMLAKGWL